ncbi:hypothetical protein I9H06_10520 [Pseudomonas tremae]|nr:hypothetical protein [Pseudomonas tremae]UQB33632.1 hypothetical protein I9H06_10520 [Pseudomonas tremae]
MAKAVSRNLQERFFVRSSYFSVLGSMCPDDAPSYSVTVWGRVLQYGCVP